jgi:hypothetical protein
LNSKNKFTTKIFKNSSPFQVTIKDLFLLIYD